MGPACPPRCSPARFEYTSKAQEPARAYCCNPSCRRRPRPRSWGASLRCSSTRAHSSWLATTPQPPSTWSRGRRCSRLRRSSPTSSASAVAPSRFACCRTRRSRSPSTAPPASSCRPATARTRSSASSCPGQPSRRETGSATPPRRRARASESPSRWLGMPTTGPSFPSWSASMRSQGSRCPWTPTAACSWATLRSGRAPGGRGRLARASPGCSWCWRRPA
mmetsp:Transcript_35114/g.88015  ORF Transcript_35114/g.88015 Transcript_35114/m.88015 type:complete len:221 (-) Transcript_35114:1344-2006(-)